MKKTISFLMTAFLSLSGFRAVAGDGVRPRIELSGEWSTPIGTCILPGTTDESRLGTPDENRRESSRLTRRFRYEGKLLYERNIIIPEEFEGRTLRLFMERTKPSTFVFDGDSIGHLTHICAPHEYLFGPVRSGRHHIALRIDNTLDEVPATLPSSHAWSENTQTDWNGILGEFFIEALPETYVESIQVYPDVASHTALICTRIRSTSKKTVTLGGVITSFNSPGRVRINIPVQKVEVSDGAVTVGTAVDMGENPLLWSEFHPALYRVEMTADGDAAAATFGMRELKVEGNRLMVNGNRVFLRGRHDGCVFPLTGYAPMDVDSWVRYFRIAAEYGINHHRYHSWTPPKAAFDAADIVGVYLQSELPMWGCVTPSDTLFNSYMLREGRMILDYAGNSPSFMSLALGNELGGDVDEMRCWLSLFREQDSRHLYCFGSNNFLGWKGQLEGEDMLVTCRTDNPDGSFSNLRASFSFADDPAGGAINGDRPGTDRDYSATAGTARLPLIGHETGQFQMFPDYSQISKYTGVLYPYNLESFRDQLEACGLADQAGDFSRASGAFAVECWKEDIEYFLRTDSMTGFQMLDLQDYPGQGTALVGILDAFMDSKGAVTPSRFREWCSPLTLMARFREFCVWNDVPFHFDMACGNYTEAPFTGTVQWRLSDTSGGWVRSGSVEASVPQGEAVTFGAADVSLEGLDVPSRLTLELVSGACRNSWHIWVYPRVSAVLPDYVTSLSDDVFSRLESGERVLYVPEPVPGLNLGGMFIPNYWSWSMFKGICEGMGKKVSPGTLGVLVDPKHPFFSTFPTEEHSDWQWWSVASASYPMILDSLSGYRPIIQVIDTFERNHRLGILFEFKVGKGSLLVCCCDPASLRGVPEGEAFLSSIAEYFGSDSFRPSVTIRRRELTSLFGARWSDTATEVESAADYSVSR